MLCYTTNSLLHSDDHLYWLQQDGTMTDLRTIDICLSAFCNDHTKFIQWHSSEETANAYGEAHVTDCR